MSKTAKLLFGNIVYTILVVPSLVYYLVAGTKDLLSALFIATLTLPWSLMVALSLGTMGIDLPDKLVHRSLILLLFVILNEFIIYRIAIVEAKRRPS